jgi:hypothetical protein
MSAEAKTKPKTGPNARGAGMRFPEPGPRLDDRARGVVWQLEDRAAEIGWEIEERVLWRAADAAKAAAWRIANRLRPARQAIETRVTWPLSDALGDRGDVARTAVATIAVVAALGSATAGAMMAGGEDGPGGAAVVAYGGGEVDAAAALTLDGVAPTFERGQVASFVPPQVKPAQPAALTAWSFANAFVLYEVGRAYEAAPVFERTATPRLAEALGQSPPRLPADILVPRAQVLNVALSERRGDQMDASVSLVRLHAVSELRLTLERSDQGWRVAQVRG